MIIIDDFATRVDLGNFNNPRAVHA
jgi:hypothetical protein